MSFSTLRRSFRRIPKCSLTHGLSPAAYPDHNRTEACAVLSSALPNFQPNLLTARSLTQNVEGAALGLFLISREDGTCNMHPNIAECLPPWLSMRNQMAPS